MIKFAPGIVFAAMALMSAPAAAQSGSMEPQRKPDYTKSCPSGWTDKSGSGTCYPQSNAMPMYPAGSYNAACPKGFGNRSGWCVRGEDTYMTDRARGTVAKANRLDRCPVAYFTNGEAPDKCITMAPNPPTVRLKGAAACGADEVDDWGIYCVSDYAALERRHANTGLRDWNAIYTVNGAQSPRQADLPEGTEYTPAYLTIFGRVKPDGSPMAGEKTAAAAEASSSDSGSQKSETAKCETTDNGAAAGAAIGGAVGGDAGAAIGGMLGGLGKKKKKKGC